MKIKEIYEMLDEDIRLNYRTKVKFAQKVGVSRSRLDAIFRCMKTDTKARGVAYNTLHDLLDKAGYEIKIIKKPSEN